MGCSTSTAMGDNINEKLSMAAYEGKYEEVEGYIAQGADPAWTDGEGWSALHGAVADGAADVRVAGLLLDRGWNIEASKAKSVPELEGRPSGGLRPLHSAALSGRAECVRLLAGRGAELDCQDENLWTPLHWAAEGANGEVIRALLSLGADRSIKNNDGNTAEDIANAKDDDRSDTIDTRSAFTS